MKIKKKFQGLSAHRYKREPLERRFAEAWQRDNDKHVSPGLLDYLMDESNRGRPDPPLSERDHLVAATVVQWLGSSVGQYFLAEILAKPEAERFHFLFDEMRRKK